MHNEFELLGVTAKFTPVLASVNFVTPSAIQAQAIPLLIEGRDVLGIAQTGTGKTAAFGLPLLQQLAAHGQPAQSKHPHGLILAPTRELAMQILAELEPFADVLGLRLGCIYGGVGQNPQVKRLRQGVDVLIATPGRLLDLVTQKHLRLGHVRVCILDEADRLLDMGFIRDVRKIVDMTPRKRQSCLFSATMPSAVTELASAMLHKPARVEVAPKQITVKKIDQSVVHISNAHKVSATATLLKQAPVKKAIVFTRTKYGADKVVRKLKAHGIEALSIHGNKSQNARIRALDSFKNGETWVLVATDIAARGIDVDGITHVINYELPHEPESYVHRIGRTGRAGANGTAFALVDPEERKRLKAIERYIKQSVPVMELELDDVPAEQTVRPLEVTEQPQNANRRRRRPRRRKANNKAA